MARDETDSSTRELIGQVTGRFHRRCVLEEIGCAGAGPEDLCPVCVVGVRSAEEPVELVEPVGERPELGLPAEVPFADEPSRIPARLEQRR
jgi:hypothetical protein